MPADRAYWMKQMSDCLDAMEREHMGSRAPVVDHEQVTSLRGEPDAMRVWCICRTVAEARLFRDSEHTRYVSSLKRKMLSAGFSETAIAALSTRITSREEIDAARGRFNFSH